MKQHSDYNRNIYLDILEDTRQDKELESRYQALESEARQLNILLFYPDVFYTEKFLYICLHSRKNGIYNLFFRLRVRGNRSGYFLTNVQHLP